MKNIERYSLAFFYWALGLIVANLIVQPGIIGKTVHILEIELPTYLNMHQHSGALLYLYAHVFVLEMLILTPVFLLVVSILRLIQKQASVFSLYTIPSIAVLGVFFEHVFLGTPTFKSVAPLAPLMMLGGTIYFVGLVLCFLVIAVASLDKRLSNNNKCNHNESYHYQNNPDDKCFYSHYCKNQKQNDKQTKGYGVFVNKRKHGLGCLRYRLFQKILFGIKCLRKRISANAGKPCQSKESSHVN